METLWNILHRKNRAAYQVNSERSARESITDMVIWNVRNLGGNYGKFITDKKRKNVEFS